ncbi:MAG: hypothetical protein ACLTY8_14775 [Lachnospiraceae bacterium]
MDVITHALEAYVSETASDCSDCLAEKQSLLLNSFHVLTAMVMILGER